MRGSGRGLAVLLAVTSGCSSTEGCAGVGTVSSDGVLFVHKGYGDLGGASFELCARGKCTKGELRQEGISDVSLPAVAVATTAEGSPSPRRGA